MKIREGSVTISVIPHPVMVKGKRYDYRRVCYHQDGKLHRPVYRIESEAVAFAKAKAIELSNGRTAANQVSTEDAASIARIKQILAERGISKAPELAIAEYCEMEAARKNLAAQKPAHLFSQLVTDFLAFKDTDGTRQRQRKTLRSLLRALEDTFQCPLESLNAGLITESLAALQVKNQWSNRTRNHYRSALSNLATWARDNLKIRRDWLEMEFVKKLKERDGEIIIWTPEEAATLFATAERVMSHLIPTMVIAFFIGHRHSEATGNKEDDVAPLDWADLNLETGEGYLKEGKVRSAGNRITHIPANAIAWLKRYRKTSGAICPYKHLSNHYRRLAKLAGMEWKQNAGRRSYISYRLAATRNLNLVSEETGTSVVTLRKRYAKPRPLTEAQKYFNIMPVAKRKRGGKTVAVEFRKPAKAKTPGSQKKAKTAKSGLRIKALKHRSKH